MKYWAYVNNEILGPYEKDKLMQLQAFSPSLLICPQTPVGEKTEDWKEASSYPEINAAMGQGISQASAAAAPAFAPAAAEAPAAVSSHEFKPLTAAAIDPVPPKESNISGINLEVGHLERSGRFTSPQAAAPAAAPAADPAARTGTNIDPISLSSIGRKADSISAGFAAPEGLAKEPPGAFSPSAAQSGGIDIGLPPRDHAVNAPSFSPAFSPAPAPAAAPAPSFAAPAPVQSFPAAAAVPLQAGPVPGLDEINRKLELLAQNSVSRQDLAALSDLRMKLDQMGEVLSSIKNSQFQRDIMDKLSYLENAVGELKTAARDRGPAPAPAPATMQPASTFVNPFSSQPAPQEQKKAEPDPKKTMIVDQGGSAGFGAKLGGVFKKLFKLVFTLALLAAVVYGAAVGLKQAGVFDVTPYLPASLPGLPKGEPAPAEAPAPEATAATEAKPEAKVETAKPVDVSPEVIYFVRNYPAVPNAPRLEDKITEVAAAAGGTYNPANWQVKSTGQDAFEAATTIPLKKGALTFTFAVDHAKKTLTPADPTGKAAFDALAKPAAGKKARRGKRGARAAAAAPAAAPAETAAAAPAAAPKAKAAAKKAPAKKIAAPEEEYEYEYEEE